MSVSTFFTFLYALQKGVQGLELSQGGCWGKVRCDVPALGKILETKDTGETRREEQMCVSLKGHMGCVPGRAASQEEHQKSVGVAVWGRVRLVWGAMRQESVRRGLGAVR